MEKQHEEQRNFGVFFDDDYNYLQHLKETSRPTELVSSGRPHRDRQPIDHRDEDEEEEEMEEGVEVAGVSFTECVWDGVDTWWWILFTLLCCSFLLYFFNNDTFFNRLLHSIYPRQCLRLNSKRRLEC